MSQIFHILKWFINDLYAVGLSFVLLIRYKHTLASQLQQSPYSTQHKRRAFLATRIFALTQQIIITTTEDKLFSSIHFNTSWLTSPFYWHILQ